MLASNFLYYHRYMYITTIYIIVEEHCFYVLITDRIIRRGESIYNVYINVSKICLTITKG